MSVKVYLDNCCYSRPYDDQTQNRIRFETQAKLQIQKCISEGKLELVSSFVLRYENSKKNNEMVRDSIDYFISRYARLYISHQLKKEIGSIAKKVMETGIDPIDSAHIACAVLAGCEFFITVDDGILKRRYDSIEIIDPIRFIKEVNECTRRLS